LTTIHGAFYHPLPSAIITVRKQQVAFPVLSLNRSRLNTRLSAVPASTVAMTDVAAANNKVEIEINDAVFCAHFKEVVRPMLSFFPTLPFPP
jgi:hypothetical protein